jgi:predicted hotdog family 3-hydroxylacyl-ACP dehydratase
MRWINALTECTATTATATAFFDEGHFAVANGRVRETALVECVAQTMAAALGQRAQSRGEHGGAAVGMLAAISNFRIQSPPPTGKELRVEVRELKRFGPMLLISGVVFCGEQRIASGELTLYA